MTNSELDGTRILRGAINIGDFIRIANGNASMREQWWRVISRSPATGPGRPDHVDLINAEGGERANFALEAWHKIVRHPYSQRRAES